MIQPDFLQSMGLNFTSNPTVNTLIMSTLIPFFIAWCNWLWGLFKIIIDRCTKIALSILKTRVLGRILGKVVCEVEVLEKNPIFAPLEQALLSQPPGNELKMSTFEMLMTMCTSGEQSWAERYANTLDSNNQYTVGLDYSGKHRLNFTSRFSEKKALRFYYSFEGYGIRIILFRSTKTQDKKEGTVGSPFITSSEICMELLDYMNRDVKKIDPPGILTRFMSQHFKMDHKLPYVYTITFGTSFHRHLEKYCQNWLNSTNGSLKQGEYDATVDGPAIQDDAAIPNAFNISTTQNNLRTVGAEDLQIQACTNTSNTVSGGFVHLYRQYVGPTENLPFQAYSYMFRKGDLYLFDKQHTNWNLHLISFGKAVTRPVINTLMDDIIKHGESQLSLVPVNKNAVSIFKLVNGAWQSYVLEKRPADTVYLPSRVRADIGNEFETFRKTERFYSECGVPYRKGILLYGPPGTGKTSLIKSLAFEYQINVYAINVNDESVNDDSIIDVLNALGSGGLKILLFEDIDTAFADKEKMAMEDKSQIEERREDSRDDTKGKGRSNQIVRRKFLTYSGLLNALDGALSNQHGVITIMTTNYIDKLGQAFIRPGRIDVKYELKECNGEQIRAMFRMFLKKRCLIFDKKDEDIPPPPATDNDYDSDGNIVPPKPIALPVTECPPLSKEIEKQIDVIVSNLVNGRDESSVTPCVLQQYMLKHITNLNEILGCYRELPAPPIAV